MSKTKYHPILFSTPMVQAILEWRKTQTRRTKGLEKVNTNPADWKFEGIAAAVHFPTEKNDLRISHYFIDKQTGVKEHIFCPYELGDVLWVRETFRPIEQEVGSPRFEYKATEAINLTDKWKPSLFMPKQACRTFLKIKSIRVERLQDISEEDSIAEGVIKEKNGQWKNYLVPQTFWTYAKYSFETLWISINGKESMNKNPFVWVYEFEQIEKPLDFLS